MSSNFPPEAPSGMHVAIQPLLGVPIYALKQPLEYLPSADELSH